VRIHLSENRFLAGEQRSARAVEDEEPLQHDGCAPPFGVFCALLAAVARRVDARSQDGKRRKLKELQAATCSAKLGFNTQTLHSTISKRRKKNESILYHLKTKSAL
jgi:hypothetical protein